MLYLSFGLALEHVVCMFEGTFKGSGCVTLQCLLFTERNMEVSGSVGGCVHPSMAVKHSIVRTLHSILNQRKSVQYILMYLKSKTS